MSSGRYQSRLFNLFSRQFLRWRDETAQTLRWAKLTATWGTQVVLYPVYALFQTARLTGKQLQQATRRVLPKLQGAKQAVQQSTTSLTYTEPTVDTPIYRSLITVQRFSLPIPLQFTKAATALEPAADSVPRNLRSTTRKQLNGSQSPKFWTRFFQPRQSSIAVEQADIEPTESVRLQQSKGNELAIAPTAPSAVTTPFAESFKQNLAVESSTSLADATASIVLLVQGIATLLETRHLVLVTQQNDILDILSIDQQRELQQRIISEVANYWRHQRVFHSTSRFSLKQSAADLDNRRSPQLLPLPADHPYLFPPVRVFRRLMAWMQTGPVARAVNLFQESALVLPASTPSVDDFIPPIHLEQQTVADQLRRWLPQSEMDTFESDEQALTWTQGEEYEIVPPAPQLRSPQTNLLASLRDWLLKRTAPSQNAIEKVDRVADVVPYQTKPTDLQPYEVPPTALAETASSTTYAVVAGTTPPQEMAALESPDAYLSTAQDPSASAVVPTAVEQTSTTINPDWIEAKATVVEYIKHPLEQVLEWLDLGMSWLERKFTNLWRWVRDRWNAPPP